MVVVKKKEIRETVGWIEIYDFNSLSMEMDKIEEKILNITIFILKILVMFLLLV